MTTDVYLHHEALAAACARCRATHVHYVYEHNGKVYATIVSDLADPRDLSARFEKRGYDVIQITHMGGEWFQFVMNIRRVTA